MGGVNMRPDPLIYEVADLGAFADAAVALADARHFAAVGSPQLTKWFHPVARTREAPLLDPAIMDGLSDTSDVVACSLDVGARESVRRFVRKASSKPGWPGAVLWHWWIYSDERILIGIHDWGALAAMLDSGLAEWADDLQAAGVLGARRADLW